MNKLVITIFSIIALSFIIIYLNYSENKIGKINIGQQQSSPEQEPIKYTFYDVLTNTKVEVDANPKKNTKKQEISQKKNKIIISKQLIKDTQKKLYQLQISTFTSIKQADSLKAQLALFAIESNISQHTLTNGKTIFRVRIGPSYNIEKLKKTRKLLESKNFKPLLMKVNL